MALSLDQIKRDFTKHRKKSAILGVLSLVMVVMFVKAWFELRPQTAAATPTPFAEAAAPDDSADETPINPEERLRQSRELWTVMREKRGLDAAAAFRFEPSYFAVDPNHQVNLDQTRVLLSDGPHSPAMSEEMQRAERERAIREEAHGFIVKSTVVGNVTSRPVAVINERVLTVGDVISGFTITAIQAREVEFKKDGITLTVKMADNGPVQ